MLFGPVAVPIPSRTDQTRFVSTAQRALVNYLDDLMCTIVDSLPITQTIGTAEPTATTGYVNLLSTFVVAPSVRLTVALSTTAALNTGTISFSTTVLAPSSLASSPATGQKPLPSTTTLSPLLGAGARIGIGVGVSVGVLAFLCALLYCWRSARR